jgi:endonuclease III
MTRKERYEKLIDYFSKIMPDVTTELNYKNNFQLLVAVILSAQCTDKRINKVTPTLFHSFPTAKEMAASSEDEIFEYIKSVSYPNNKAKHLLNMSKILMEKFNGEVPDNINELTTLPGVGRKTANVIEAVAFGRSAMPVDTHVYRVSHRLGLVPKTCKTVYSVEKELVKNLPMEKIALAHHWLLLHGRYVCTSRNPHCDSCKLNEFCAKDLSESSKLQK